MMGRRSDFEDAIGAIRLALEGAANDHSAVVVIRDILERTPPSYGDHPGPVRVLVKSIKKTKAQLRVPAA